MTRAPETLGDWEPLTVACELATKVDEAPRQGPSPRTRRSVQRRSVSGLGNRLSQQTQDTESCSRADLRGGPIGSARNYDYSGPA